jgi:hypothetical protein
MREKFLGKDEKVWRDTPLLEMAITIVLYIAILIAASSCSSTKSEVRENMTTHDSLVSKDSTVIRILPHSWWLDITGNITYPDLADSSDYYLSVDATVPDNNGIDSHKVTVKVRPKTKEIAVTSKQLKNDTSKTVYKNENINRVKDIFKSAIKTETRQPSIWEQFKNVITLLALFALLIGGLYLWWRFKK